MTGKSGTNSERYFEIGSGDATLSGKLARGSRQGEVPKVIVAIHGGTYNADYFDVPGYSLLDRAVAHGFDAVAIDRPGYRASTPLPDAPDLIEQNARKLNAALPDLLGSLGLRGARVFLVGHSIGGAIALTMAAREKDWNLCGVAVSGVGARTPPEDAENYARLPQQYFVELPTEMKDIVMFGPAGSHAPDMPAASHFANTAVPRSELTDITGGWQDRVTNVASAIDVPVHYRQGQHEKLWLSDGQIVQDFGRLFVNSPSVDAGLVADAGHCIDFHLAGKDFQTAQLDFARRSFEAGQGEIPLA